MRRPLVISVIAMKETWIEVTEQPLAVEEADDLLRDPACGAVSLFVGTTRQFTDGRETLRLEYEAYEPMALQEIQRLAEACADRWEVWRLVLLHRLGVVPIAEASVVIGVATPHREDSFSACRFLIDALKQQVPIWKKEIFADGSTEWVSGAEKPPLSVDSRDGSREL